MYDYLLKISNGIHRKLDFKKKLREKLEGSANEIKMNYDDYIVFNEHEQRGWNSEDLVECIQCGTFSAKELCSRSCEIEYSR